MRLPRIPELAVLNGLALLVAVTAAVAQQGGSDGPEEVLRAESEDPPPDPPVLSTATPSLAPSPSPAATPSASASPSPVALPAAIPSSSPLPTTRPRRSPSATPTDSRPRGGCQPFVGRAVDGSGQPVPGMHVVQRTSPGAALFDGGARTSLSGLLTGVAGGGQLLVSPTGIPARQDATTRDLQPAAVGQAGEPLCARLDADGYATVTDVVMRPGARLRGAVRPGAAVEAVRLEIAGWPFSPVTVSASSSYHLVGLPAGRGLLRATCRTGGRSVTGVGVRVSLVAGSTSTHDLTVPCPPA